MFNPMPSNAPSTCCAASLCVTALESNLLPATQGGKRTRYSSRYGTVFRSDCLIFMPSSLSQPWGSIARPDACLRQTNSLLPTARELVSMRYASKLKRCLQVLLHLRDSRVHPNSGQPSSPGRRIRAPDREQLVGCRTATFHGLPRGTGRSFFALCRHKECAQEAAGHRSLGCHNDAETARRRGYSEYHAAQTWREFYVP